MMVLLFCLLVGVVMVAWCSFGISALRLYHVATIYCFVVFVVIFAVINRECVASAGASHFPCGSLVVLGDAVDWSRRPIDRRFP